QKSMVTRARERVERLRADGVVFTLTGATFSHRPEVPLNDADDILHYLRFEAGERCSADGAFCRLIAPSEMAECLSLVPVYMRDRESRSCIDCGLGACLSPCG